MSLKFTQKEVEIEIANCLESGDIKAISNISGIGYSYIDQQLNPNDERKSAIYQALLIVCALDEEDAKRGEKLWQKIVYFRECSKPENANDDCLDFCAAALAKESTEAVAARLTGKNLVEQLKEVLDAETAIAKLKAGIISQINKEKTTENNSGILRAVK